MFCVRKAPFVILFVATAAMLAPRIVLAGRADGIDPSRRAAVSTGDAVRPTPTNPKASGVVGSRRIPVTRIPTAMASLSQSRSPVVVSETQVKKVTLPSARGKMERRTFATQRASNLPASIPRLDTTRYYRTLSEYREGRKSAAGMSHQQIRVGTKTVDIGQINRFANPRSALEAQGIPVVSAGGGEESPTDSAAVPISGNATSK